MFQLTFHRGESVGYAGFRPSSNGLTGSAKSEGSALSVIRTRGRVGDDGCTRPQAGLGRRPLPARGTPHTWAGAVGVTGTTTCTTRSSRWRQSLCNCPSGPVAWPSLLALHRRRARTLPAAVSGAALPRQGYGKARADLCSSQSPAIVFSSSDSPSRCQRATSAGSRRAASSSSSVRRRASVLTGSGRTPLRRS